MNEADARPKEKMMRNNQKFLRIVIAAGILGGLVFIIGLARSQQPGATIVIAEPEATLDFANPPSNITVHQDIIIIAYTREELIDLADVIFEGKVLSISPTFWNQDSGEYWYDEAKGIGIQLHAIELEVLQPIVDMIGVETQITIFILGASPLDGLAEGDGTLVFQEDGGDYDLKVGDQVIFFANQRELAWREGGPRKLLMSNPILDAFIQMPDGLYHDPWNEKKPISLEEMINQIAERREVLAVP
jgi:hypothetical protein